MCIRDSFYFGAYQVDVGGNNYQCINLRVVDSVAHIGAVYNTFIDSTFCLLDVYAQP